jgi:hypothetical protein
MLAGALNLLRFKSEALGCERENNESDLSFQWRYIYDYNPPIYNHFICRQLAIIYYYEKILQIDRARRQRQKYVQYAYIMQNV